MKPKKIIEGQELLLLVLETVQQLKEKFKAEHIVDILKGNETSDITSYQHDELENYGVASDEEEKLLHAVIRQAMIAGYISKDIETYGVLKLTPAGKEYLKKPLPFPIVKDTEFEEDDEEAAGRTVGAGPGRLPDPRHAAVAAGHRRAAATGPAEPDPRGGGVSPARRGGGEAGRVRSTTGATAHRSCGRYATGAGTGRGGHGFPELPYLYPDGDRHCRH